MSASLFDLRWALPAMLVGCAWTAWLFWPGFTSPDSAVQYAQALAGTYDTSHPPLMAMVWRLTERVIPGPGGMFALFQALWWGGLAALLALTVPGRARRTLAFVALGVWPPVLLMLAHVWKDVGLAAALLAATAATAGWRLHGARGARIAAFVLLLIAVALRHNGLPAALPLLWLLVLPRAGEPWRMKPRAAAFAAMLLVLVAFPALVARLPGVTRVQFWPTVALWDLAAISTATGEMHVPRTVAPALTLEDIREFDRPWANVPLFGSNEIRLSIFVPYTDEESRELRDAWLGAIRDHPGAYARHRARVLRYLLFGYDGAPRELVYVPERVLPPDAPTDVIGTQGAAQRVALAVAERTWATPLFWGAPYLLLAFVLVAWRRTRHAAHGLTLALAASALFYALPLAIAAGSGDFRYLFWTVVATLLAAVIASNARATPQGS